MKSMLDATNQAFGNMQNMAKQMTEIADANLQAASSVTAKAVGARQKRSKAVQLFKNPAMRRVLLPGSRQARSRTNRSVAPGQIDAAPLDFDTNLRHRLFDQRRLAFDAELEMPTLPCRPARARKQAQRRIISDDALHQTEQCALVGPVAGQQERLRLSPP